MATLTESERLYTGSLRVLDVVSAWSLPALQSASLRSYVLVLILAAALLTIGALCLARAAPCRI